MQNAYASKLGKTLLMLQLYTKTYISYLRFMHCFLLDSHYTDWYSPRQFFTASLAF